MAYSSQNKIFDAHRKKNVKATPEELVRNELYQVLTHQLGFPKALVALEKKITELPLVKELGAHLNRRIDLLCFANNEEGKTFPLLLIECKAVPIQEEEKEQAFGYNALIKAPFVALVNQTEAKTYYFDHEKGYYHCKDGLFSYLTLLQILRDKNDDQ